MWILGMVIATMLQQFPLTEWFTTFHFKTNTTKRKPPATMQEAFHLACPV
jgi:hypothetical protein